MSSLRFDFEYETDQHDPCDRRWNLFHHALTRDLLVHGLQVDLSARFGWVPLLNVAQQFAGIERRLDDQHGAAALEFTESEDRLHFVRTNTKVRVSATYATGVANLPIDEVGRALRSFRQWAVTEVIQRHPCVQRRPEFVRAFGESTPQPSSREKRAPRRT